MSLCSEGSSDLRVVEVGACGAAWRSGEVGMTRAIRLVTRFEPREHGAGGVGEVGVEGEALAVDLDGR